MTSELLATAIGFELRGRPGRVLAKYGVNQDPERWGYPLLGLDPLVEVSRGFPVLQVEVEHGAEGYAAIMAWIQVVQIHDLDSGKRDTVIDGPPQLAGLDLPYVTFGPHPMLFDAPSTNESSNLDWDAHATLVVSPDCMMTRRVQPLCGFSWGYRIRSGKPSPTTLRESDSHAWDDDCGSLREQHPSWIFDSYK